MRQGSLGCGLTEQRKHFTFANLTATAQADDLCQPAEGRYDSAVIADANVVETGLIEIDCAIWRPYFKHLAGSQIPDIKECRSIAEGELCTVVGECHRIKRSIWIEPGKIAPAERERAMRLIARVDAVTD